MKRIEWNNEGNHKYNKETDSINKTQTEIELEIKKKHMLSNKIKRTKPHQHNKRHGRQIWVFKTK